MKRIFIVFLVTFLYSQVAVGASWKTTKDEDASIDGTEIVYLENGAGTDNNWAFLTTIKTWVLSGLSAVSVSIEDVGTYFTGENIEAALQEIGASLATKLDAGDVVTVTSDVETFLGSENKAAMLTNLGPTPLNGLLDGSITNPADSDDMIYVRSQKAITITDIYCVAEGTGTITLTLQECDNATCASPSGVEGAITCDADGAEDDGTLTDGSGAAGAWYKVLFSAPTGTVTSLAWSVEGVQTW